MWSKRYSEREEYVKSTHTARKTILVVEDDPSLLATLEFNLETTGYQALTATDGATALDIRRSNDGRSDRLGPVLAGDGWYAGL